MLGVYDTVHYPSLAICQTHPNRLATLGTLFGMKPAPIDRCRVLELACGDGGNLIPMALGLPQSQFLGIDLAEKPIRAGQAIVARLGLKNISLCVQDLLDVPRDLGQFDYILAHGVYSWVSEEIRDRILALCRAHLGPQGVAFVSYTAYPGGHLREMVREMMLFQIRSVQEPAKQVEEGMALIRFLARAFPEGHPHGDLLTQELRLMEQRPTGAVYHDELAEIYAPVYFFEFAAHARQHGLQFLTEATVFENPEPAHPTPVAAQLARLDAEGKTIEREQVADFLCCRRFRHTLLCHENVRLRRGPEPALLTAFNLMSYAAPVSAAIQVAAETVEEFTTAKGNSTRQSLPLAKAALLHLHHVAPRGTGWRELVQAASERLGCPDPHTDDLSRLAGILWTCMKQGLLELRVHEPTLVSEPGEFPMASPLVRLQIERDVGVTSLTHRPVTVREPSVRRLIPLLDGTRDRAGLLDAMTRLAQESAAPVSGCGPRPGGDAIRTLPELNVALAALAKRALLVQ
jgi:SAM-dependent methyltransferase